MLKIRLQGTKEDIRWFRERVLEQNKSVNVSEVSDFYTNKGTKNFFRNYIEVKRAKKNR